MKTFIALFTIVLFTSCENQVALDWLLNQQEDQTATPAPAGNVYFEFEISDTQGEPNFLFDIMQNGGTIEIFTIVLDYTNPTTGSLVQIREIDGEGGRIIFQLVPTVDGSSSSSFSVDPTTNEVSFQLTYESITYTANMTLTTVTAINNTLYVGSVLSANPDSDNDGIIDENDSDPLNPNVCSDTDADGCDDCSNGTYDPNNDGTDTDGDGLCDTGDPDDDDDGVLDENDSDPLNPNVCSDTDADGCNDCSNGTYDPNSDGTDTDGDGLCDTGDPDDDDDGVLDENDSDPLNPNVCSDTDADGCDDCSNGTYDPNNDGTDTDGDGICDSGENKVPIFESGETISFPENGTGSVVNVDANDGDGGATDAGILFSLSGGADQSAFDLDAFGVLTFKNSPDFENPSDANSDNDYIVIITADDGFNTTDQTITISVTDINENQAPTISAHTFDIDENSTNGTIIGTIVASDPDGDNLTFTSEVNDDNDHPFAISSDGELTVKQSSLLDFENVILWVFTVTVSDGLGGQAVGVLTINVKDVDESILSLKNQTHSIQIYPNPARDYINLDLQKTRLTDVKLLSLDGQIVRDFGTQNRSVIQLDLKEVKTGIYLLSVYTDGISYLQKVIIK